MPKLKKKKKNYTHTKPKQVLSSLGTLRVKAQGWSRYSTETALHIWKEDNDKIKCGSTVC